MSRLKVIIPLIALFLFPFDSMGASNSVMAQSFDTYTVKSGDTMWKIAMKYQIGVSEIINANSHIENPDLIYPNQKLKIPNIDDLKSIEQTVITLVNKERAKRGLNGLQADWEVSRVARYKSNDMQAKGYFSHQSPTYGSPFNMLKHFGVQYKMAGENIANGQTSPEEVMKSWMNSSGHRANILNAEYTHIGVGYNVAGKYWTQMFIKK
jgi:uncharacterized YkwD family protein/spore coat assembly protein SafA